MYSVAQATFNIACHKLSCAFYPVACSCTTEAKIVHNGEKDVFISETSFYAFLWLSMASMSVTLLLEFCAVYTRIRHRGTTTWTI